MNGFRNKLQAILPMIYASRMFQDALLWLLRSGSHFSQQIWSFSVLRCHWSGHASTAQNVALFLHYIQLVLNALVKCNMLPLTQFAVLYSLSDSSNDFEMSFSDSFLLFAITEGNRKWILRIIIIFLCQNPMVPLIYSIHCFPDATSQSESHPFFLTSHQQNRCRPLAIHQFSE